jgi:hypothetical protein
VFGLRRVLQLRYYHCWLVREETRPGSEACSGVVRGIPEEGVSKTIKIRCYPIPKGPNSNADVKTKSLEFTEDGKLKFVSEYCFGEG